MYFSYICLNNNTQHMIDHIVYWTTAVALMVGPVITAIAAYRCSVEDDRAKEDYDYYNDVNY